MKVVLSGFGAMGQVLLNEVTTNQDFELCGVVDKFANFGHKTFDELSVVPDVIIDFSHPDNLNDLIKYAVSNNVGLVVATTGLTEQQFNYVVRASIAIPILFTGNTSLGINLMNQLVKKMAEVLNEFDIEIIEKHHNKKIDAPSGTANMLVDSISEIKDVNVLYGRSGLSKREANDLTVHAVRGGTITGEHTVIFAGEDEMLELKHTALSKRVFAKGALKAATFVNTKDHGLFSMKDIF